MPQRILVIEDNHDIAHLVELHLKDSCFEVELAADGRTGLELARNGAYDLIVLDIMLPELDGLEVCRQLRGAANQTPILMLTAKSAELDRVVGLELGADDYLTKPFSIRELLARVKAILRRAETTAKASTDRATDRIEISGLCIEPERREVSIEGKPVELTAREFDLLHYFASHPGRVFSREQLLNQVWGYGHDGYQHTVNSHINRLRKKIERDPADARYILTVWGVGYKFTGPQPGQG
ncbi:MAG: response regulator transcription factor [Gammaproteobacteria bacterium]|nr:response regulator transcription factor [Gammaproteobacteria bacterium]